jgi:hypothetical protein
VPRLMPLLEGCSPPISVPAPEIASLLGFRSAAAAALGLGGGGARHGLGGGARFGRRQGLVSAAATARFVGGAAFSGGDGCDMPRSFFSSRDSIGGCSGLFFSSRNCPPR